MSNIFKAYDVRGVYPEEINKENAYKIGFATVKFLLAKSNGKKLNLIIGEDCRIASPTLRGAVIDAITKAGANVSYIGLCTTPLFYFSVNQLKADGGIMVTSSHNPPQYGGLKIVGTGSSSIAQNTGLLEVQRLAEESIEITRSAGTVEEINLVPDYIDFVIQKSGVSPPKLKKVKLVIDAGNGMKPIVLKPLFEKLGVSYMPLYFEVDCNFPNHSPDITKEGALEGLRKKIIEQKADIGIAFDGDGDRIIFMDENGIKIDSGCIFGLLFNDKSRFFSKPRTVYDLRFSRSVKELVGKSGIKSRVGYVFIKELMDTHSCDLGGELSGHFFFKETNYTESSSLVMLKILKILSENDRKISELIKPFQKYYYSGEINTELGDTSIQSSNEESKKKAVTIMNRIKEEYKDGKIDELDGVTIDLWDKDKFWFNVRPSNSEPVLRLVVEAKTKELMDQKVKELTQVIKNAPQ